MARVVLITAPIDQPWLERLQQVSPDITIEHRPPQSNQPIPDDLWKEVEINYGLPWKLPTPQQVPQLRWIQLYSAGADRLLTNPLYQSSIIFTTASGVHAINIAEYVFTMVEARFHRVPQLLELQRQKQWASQQSPELQPEELYGKTIGIAMAALVARLRG